MDYRLFPETELTEGAMRQVEVAGRHILLSRVAGRCHAVDAICPHAGAPLGEGVLHDGIVICPWHKAAFRVATGARVQPPAVDDLASFPVRAVDGVLRVSIDEPCEPDRPAAASDTRCMAVVGSGAAGFAAAQTLREEGFAGRVVLISQEDRLPYDRTVLSKYALSGKKGGEKSPLQDQAFFDRMGIELVFNPVTALDAPARSITFADGSRLAYDAALVATGGRPMRLEVPGSNLPGVHVLRSPDDFDAVLASVKTARRVVVVGAGFIGLEAAGSLRERGLHVSVVAPQRAPLERQLGQKIGAVFQRVHEAQGVFFHMGEEVAAVEGAISVEAVRLKSGASLPADLVIVGLGITPATDVLQGVALREDRGVSVDRTLRVTDGLYAAGDIAAFPLGGTGEAIRVEHWRVAQQHGRVAALNMLGRDQSFDSVPYFWTIHYLKRLDYVGHASSWDDIVVQGSLDEPNFIALYVAAGIVRAVAGWGRDQQMAATIPLMEARQDWTAAGLTLALRG